MENDCPLAESVGIQGSSAAGKLSRRFHYAAFMLAPYRYFFSV